MTAVADKVRDDPMRRLHDALQQAEEELLFANLAYAVSADSGTSGFGYENIVGVGLGDRLSGGRPTGEPAVKVYVVRKAPRDQLEAEIPSSFDDVPTDVVESGEFVAATERGRERPLSVGLSVGPVDGGTGTLGFFASTDADERVMVSNNHVLASENRADVGNAVLQPGPADGGEPTDQVGALRAFVPLDFAGEANLVDLAIATVDEAVDAGSFPGGSLNAEPERAEKDLVVRKRGRSSGLTAGIVSDPRATIKLRYLHGTAILRDQFLVKGLDNAPFSQSGDSGALVVDGGARRPVGLLCGGSVRFSVVNRIEHVLDALGLTFQV
jgi:hypothetical protein